MYVSFSMLIAEADIVLIKFLNFEKNQKTVHACANIKFFKKKLQWAS